MANTVTLRAQIDRKLKESAESIFKKMGISASDAISTFYHAVKHNRGIPGGYKVPNPTTRKVMRDTDRGKNLIEYKNAEEMFQDQGL